MPRLATCRFCRPPQRAGGAVGARASSGGRRRRAVAAAVRKMALVFPLRYYLPIDCPGGNPCHLVKHTFHSDRPSGASKSTRAIINFVFFHNGNDIICHSRNRWPRPCTEETVAVSYHKLNRRRATASRDVDFDFITDNTLAKVMTFPQPLPSTNNVGGATTDVSTACKEPLITIFSAEAGAANMALDRRVVNHRAIAIDIDVFFMLHFLSLRRCTIHNELRQ